ncbi:hypothetical protein D8674_010188 [Pyrus ussuriensis x Pyrus communis]|uniref:Uncharacterized protein n=1 Tax=Pyrus ussuriensis x Pyrus communis TaxID=2448454 RepID=A0A5N5FAC3_9ROSA|nr:hypothetical protein D8674_010188 [Pyrus ussuriensis x Pyrus communis]
MRDEYTCPYQCNWIAYTDGMHGLKEGTQKDRDIVYTWEKPPKCGYTKKIPQLEKSLRYAKMTDPEVSPQILWSKTTKKQPTFWQLKMYIIESREHLDLLGESLSKGYEEDGSDDDNDEVVFTS